MNKIARQQAYLIVRDRRLVLGLDKPDFNPFAHKLEHVLEYLQTTIND